jgi:hypothetical protein
VAGTARQHEFKFWQHHAIIDPRSKAARSRSTALHCRLAGLAEAALLQGSCATDARYFKGCLMLQLLSPRLIHVELLVIMHHTGTSSPPGRGGRFAEGHVHDAHVVSRNLLIYIYYTVTSLATLARALTRADAQHAPLRTRLLPAVRPHPAAHGARVSCTLRRQTARSVQTTLQKLDESLAQHSFTR